MRGLRNYLILLGFAGAFLACQADKSCEIRIGMLPGRYCFNEGNASDSLFLHDDGTYLHKHFASKSQVLHSKGKWQYDSIAMKISFYDFIFYNETGSINSPGGVWHSKVHLTNGGELRLIYSRENGVYYYNNSKK